MSFVNLHAHSHYSLLDGYGSPREMILRSKELGYPACGLTDHGVAYGLLEFYKEGKKEGIKPILGCELYIAPRTRFDKEAGIDVKPYHLTILAKNNTGYQNLLKLVSKAHLEGFYYKPRVDYGLLKTYSEGLIALSGCLAAHLPRTILSGNEDEIHKVMRQYLEIFGKENFFLEVQDHPLMEHQVIVNERLRDLAKEYDLDLVATNDSHYPRPEDSEAHDVLLCIQTGSNVNDDDRMRYVGDYSIREVNDLKSAFMKFPGAIDNTLKIAEMCNVDFSFGESLIPSFPTPQNEKPDDYLKQLCFEGLKRRFGDKEVPQEYIDRLNYELELVNKMGFDTYFLIVSDFVRYAKGQNIAVGPGRGSAAGAIIAWSLDITDVDPIAYGLFFERFLNPERVSMPDIDIDFADHRRDEVLNYVVDKYGRDNVAQIITFGTMAARAAVRDVGRALGYPYQEVDQLAKIIPPPVLGKHTPLAESIENDPELSKAYRAENRTKVLLDYAKQLEGTVRHVGTHACAVVISEKPLTDYTALQFGASGREEIVTQFSAGPLEDLGLLKMDFLGLRNLTIIEKTCELVKDRHNIEVDVGKLPLDDTKTFELLQKGDTTGVFQLESAGMRRYLKELKPTEFEDIVAMGALYRPGPMEWIPTYIKGKHNPEKVKYLHKSFKPILQKTYGVAVYQEQILQIARDFAGFSLGEADILRKAVGKKIASLLVEQREMFVKGAIKNGYDEKFAYEVFEKVIEPFAGYGFNRAHAVCYAMIAYQTAYLKAHYPIEFMTALLYSDAGNTDRVVLEIKECSEMGIAVLPPSVNESFTHFAITGANQIRFGLLSIKGVGEGPVQEIIDVREKSGPFKSLEDFARRIPSKILNKKLLQSLAYGGALDEFGDRNQIADNHAEISKYAKNVQETVSNGQTDIFGMLDDSECANIAFQMRNVPKATRMQALRWEKDYLGMYVSGHPLKGLTPYIARKAHLVMNLQKKHVDKVVKLIGLVSEFRKFMTKSGTYMASFMLEDSTARVNVVVFPRGLSQIGDVLSEDSVVALSGKLSNRRGQYQIVCDTAKVLSIETMVENAREQDLFDPEDRAGLSVRLLDDILDEVEDSVEVTEDVGDVPDVDAAVNAEVYCIEIPAGLDKEKMETIKKLLMSNKGLTPVEILLSSANRRIKLPFGVEVTADLKTSIDSLLA